jgi:hypothetical protein
MLTLEQISPSVLRDVDAVVVFDPATDKAVTVWGENLISDREPRIVEIPCRETDVFTFRRIIETVRETYGCTSSHLTDPPRYT